MLHQPSDNTGDPNQVSGNETGEIMFIAFQGKFNTIDDNTGRLVALDRETKTVIWEHKQHRRYFDVDPIDKNTILFSATRDLSNGESDRVAIVMNWRTGEVKDKFVIPKDTHDIDYLGDGKYAIADKASHKAYILDRNTDETVWQFRFADHFSEKAGDGINGDYTHLNDIDSVNNGSAFLVSPRNFDRVMLINRSTNQVEWVLGEEDNYDILYEQHNPVLLSQDPPTVLVADSENDRIVEYQKKGQEWELTWSYYGQLNWPRDADRLPNGNTLIVDSNGDRVVEVTPDREVVWELAIRENPYDAELLKYGDEPQGPPMTEFKSEFGSPIPEDHSQSHALSPLFDAFDSAYYLAQWVLPSWIDKIQFLFLLAAGGVLISWLTAEAVIKIPLDRVRK